MWIRKDPDFEYVMMVYTVSPTIMGYEYANVKSPSFRHRDFFSRGEDVDSPFHQGRKKKKMQRVC